MKFKILFSIIVVGAYLLCIYVLVPRSVHSQMGGGSDPIGQGFAYLASLILFCAVVLIVSLIVEWMALRSLRLSLAALAVALVLCWAIENIRDYVESRNSKQFHYSTGELLAEGVVLNYYTRTGAWKTFRTDGSLQTKENFTDKYHRTYAEYYENGKIKSRGAFGGYSPQGEWKFYDETGKLIEKRTYTNQGEMTASSRCRLMTGFSDGWLSFSVIESGLPFMGKAEKMPFVRTDRIKNLLSASNKDFSCGEYTPILIPSDVEFITANIVNGHPDGEVSYYRDDAQQSLRQSYRWENGMPDGLETCYHPNGAISSTVMWVQGKKEGEARQYNPEGRLIVLCRYVNGLREGELQAWYAETGATKQTGQFIEDEPHGLWVHYHKNGSVHELEQYDNGTLESYREYDEHGRALNYIVYGTKKTGEESSDKYYAVTAERIKFERLKLNLDSDRPIYIVSVLANMERNQYQSNQSTTPTLYMLVNFAINPGQYSILDSDTRDFNACAKMLKDSERTQIPVRVLTFRAKIVYVEKASPQDLDIYMSVIK